MGQIAKKKSSIDSKAVAKSERKYSVLFDSVEEHRQAIADAQFRWNKISVKFLLLIGEHLSKAHAKLARHGDGVFGKWCVDRLKINRKKARRARQVYERFGVCDNLSQLSQFDVSALYKLAEPKAPKEVIEQAMTRAGDGKRITHRRVKNMLWKHEEALMLAEQEPEDELPRKKSTTPREEDDGPYSTETFDKLKMLWIKASKREKREFKFWIKERVRGQKAILEPS